MMQQERRVMTTLLSREQLGLDVIEFMPGKKASLTTLKALLPDVETTLFFAKALDMDYQQLSALLYSVHNTSVTRALNEGAHSETLQDYLCEDILPAVYDMEAEDVEFADIPHGEILPEVWESITLQVASSLKEVAGKLADVIDAMPSKEGSMTFSHMAKLNRQRPTMGVYQAHIQHQRVSENLVVLDVSGSMSSHTVHTIINDVVALSWKANASLAIVSDTTRLWAPGTYTVDGVLAEAEYSGTHYETLAPLFNQNWGTVVTIADYDSGHDARRKLSECTGRIGLVLDISLVNKPTFLAECLGQLADETRPLLVGNSGWVLSA